MNVCRHELGGLNPPLPRNSNPGCWFRYVQTGESDGAV